MTSSFKLARRVLGAATIALVTVITVPGTGFAETGWITDHSAIGELNFWNSIKGSADPVDLKRYLEEFPDGMFFDPAAARYEQLTGQKLDLRSVENASISSADTTNGTQIDQDAPLEAVVKTSSKKKVNTKAAKKTTKKAVSTKKSKKKVTSKVSKKKIPSRESIKRTDIRKKAANKKIVSTKKVNCTAGQSGPACGRTVGTGNSSSGGNDSSGGGGWN